MKHTTAVAMLMRIASLAALLLFWAGPASVQPVHAQADLIARYQSARVHMLSDRAIQEREVLMPPRPPVPLSLSEAAEWPWGPTEEAEPEPEGPAFTVDTWEPVSKLRWEWFRKTFEDTRWAYRGANEIESLDTMYTWQLRARLQQRFGSPTLTVVELLPEDSVQQQGSHSQFRYALVLNGYIPLTITDVNGPFERGVVLATDLRFADQFEVIRDALLEELTDVEPAPFVDYFFDGWEQAWYRTGYDGQEQFLEPIREPNLYLGRPRLMEE